MFSRELYNLTLTSDIANDVFPNIMGETYGGDNSYLATLRALLAPRMNENDNLYLRVRVRNDRENTIKGYTDADGARELSSGIDNNTIFVCGLNGTEAGVTASFQKIEKSFLKVRKGFVELEDLHVFVQKQANIRFYINVETRSVAIFVGGLNTRLWHFIQALTPRLFPWYFGEKPELSDAEKELIKSLTNKYAPDYQRLIEEFASKYDFRGKRIAKMIGGFERKAKQKKLDMATREVRDCNQRIENNEREYRELLERREAAIVKEDGLRYQVEHATDDSELVEYFVCNKHILPISVTDRTMEIIVDCTLDNYDPDLYERMTNNKGSYLFVGYNPTAEVFKSFEARKKFLDAIFSDEPLFQIKLRGYYKLDFAGSVSSCQGYTFPEEYVDFLTNPHLDIFACIGNNRAVIDRMLRNGDYITAIEQSISSAKNLNLTEGQQTVAPFLGKLFAAGCKSVMLMPDGSSCTPTEAYNWMIAQEAQPEPEPTEVENVQEVEK